MYQGWYSTYEGKKVNRVTMCEVRSRKKRSRTKQRKQIDCDEPHLMSNGKTQPIQWI
jgi:hypothetical protein